MMNQLNDPSAWLSKTFDCACGRRHEVPIRRVEVAAGALASLADYIAAEGIRLAAVVADARTVAVAGIEVQRRLAAAGVEARVVVLRDTRAGEVVADEAGIVGLLKELPPDAEAVIAVGSGTIHDIVRFACHAGRRRFISVPTAPSVDGFASVGAPIVLGGFKTTLATMAPEAIFADLDILCRAPREMIAAGFGDMLGKYTSLADWQLGHLLTGEHDCPLCREVTRRALETCIRNLDAIAQARPEGIKALTEALILSGISILLLGNSRPASGAEHHLSHFWEMRYLQEDRKALLHGAKVGAATVIICRLYEHLARLLRQETPERLAQRLGARVQEDAGMISKVYGSAAGHVLEENGLARPGVTEGEALSAAAAAADTAVSVMRERLVTHADEILAVAESVPGPRQAAEWLAAAGGAIRPGDLGVPEAMERDSLQAAHYVRSRMTVLRLMHALSVKV